MLVNVGSAGNTATSPSNIEMAYHNAYLLAKNAIVIGRNPLMTESVHHNNSGKKPPALETNVSVTAGAVEEMALPGEEMRAMELPAAFLRALITPSCP